MISTAVVVTLCACILCYARAGKRDHRENHELVLFHDAVQSCQQYEVVYDSSLLTFRDLQLAGVHLCVGGKTLVHSH